jgi:DinB superfamily
MLLDLLDEAFDKKSWHGPNLRGSIRGVTARQAAWRPGDDRHNIWELTLHAAYWKYAARRRLSGGKRGSFVLAGSNFFVRPIDGTKATEQAWKADIKILLAEHQQLRAAVTQVTKPSSAQARMMRGVAAHDLYHAGQIRLLRRLCPE